MHQTPSPLNPRSPQPPQTPESPESPEFPESPEDHRRFSLGEDWCATIAGLAIVLLCLLGAVPEGMLP